nr:DUF2651 family protein [Sporosarcina sp. JAI121]
MSVELLTVFVIVSLAVLATSIIGLFFVQQWYLIPLGVFAVLTILTFIFFNKSFFIWVIVLTGFSAIVSFGMGLIRKGNDNQKSVV